MFRHTFFTWLWANIAHPIFILFYVLYRGESIVPSPDDNYVTGFVITLSFSLLLSLPCLLLAWLLLSMIIDLRLSLEIRFVIWWFTAPLLVLVEYLVISFLWDIVDVNDMELLLPATAATFVVILIRFKAFERLIYSPQPEDHESNLV